MSQAHDPYAALRFRDYRCLLSGAVLASVGMEVLDTAASWELYKRTGSFAVLGYAKLAQFLPVLFFALPAGQVADRVSRNRVVQAAQTTIAVSALGLALLSWWEAPVWPYLLAVLIVFTIVRIIGWYRGRW